MNNIDRYDIVMFALPRWDGDFSSTALSISKVLSSRTRVFYIDNPFTVKDIITGFFTKSIRKRLWALIFGVTKYRLIQHSNPQLINATPLVTLPINFLSPGKLYNALRKFNERRVYRCLISLQNDYKLNNYIFINSYNPFYFQNTDKLKSVCSIYHCVDDISESRYIGKHGSLLEIAMISRYDLTFTTSRKLHQYVSQFTADAYCLPNAADFNLFHAVNEKEYIPRPVELEHINTKVVGYIGSVDHRIDYAILHQIARTDCVVLLVGPTGVEFEKSGLNSYNNVISVGSKPLEELPYYVKFMDCGIIPFLCNKLTESIYPLKLNEYLAVGVPVVTTGFSEDLADFASVIEIVKSPVEFEEAIHRQISGDNSAKRLSRIEVARGNTWESRVQQFWNIVSSKL